MTPPDEAQALELFGSKLFEGKDHSAVFDLGDGKCIPAYPGFDEVWLAAWNAAIARQGEDRGDALIKAVQTWAGDCEGIPQAPHDVDLLKALWTYDGDRTEPCEGCDGDCDEPCAPCTVAAAHATLDAAKDIMVKPNSRIDAARDAERGGV